MKLTYVLPVLFVMLCSLRTFSQTVISGGIYNDTTLSSANSPYNVVEDLVVFQGVTLTIEPGVILKFDKDIKLDIRGQLIAIGTETNHILFTSLATEPEMGDWKGILVTGTTDPLGVGDQVGMKYCTGEYAEVFIDLTIAYHGPYLFEHCTFKSNEKVNNDIGMPSTKFRFCHFESNDRGLEGGSFESEVSHSTFLNNNVGADGLDRILFCHFKGHNEVAVEPYGKTVGNVIEQNKIGVKSFFNSANDHFENNEIIDNEIGIQIERYFNGSILFSNNIICSNSEYNVQLLQANNADISGNCWCDKSSSALDGKIFDGHDDPSNGLITYEPRAESCPEVVIGVEDKEQKPEFTVYPNPFMDYIVVGPVAGNQTILNLYSISGNRILTSSITGTEELETSALASGVYIIELIQDGYVQRGKAVKSGN